MPHTVQQNDSATEKVAANTFLRTHESIGGKANCNLLSFNLSILLLSVFFAGGGWLQCRERSRGGGAVDH